MIVFKQNIESVLTESRTFSPPESFVKQTNLQKEEYERLLLKAKTDFDDFWSELAEKNVHWFKKWLFVKLLIFNRQ